MVLVVGPGRGAGRPDAAPELAVDPPTPLTRYLAALRSIAHGNNPETHPAAAMWAAWTARGTRIAELEEQLRGLVTGWRDVADDQSGNHYREGYGDALHRAADELEDTLSVTEKG